MAIEAAPDHLAPKVSLVSRSCMERSSSAKNKVLTQNVVPATWPSPTPPVSRHTENNKANNKLLIASHHCSLRSSVSSSCLKRYFMCSLLSIGLQCKRTVRGVEYKGTQNITVTGRECVVWVDTLTLLPTLHLDLPDMTVEDAGNFCRNLGGMHTGPVCYVWTRDGGLQLEDCDVTLCGEWLAVASLSLSLM